jgi:hypothetical protein
MPKFECLGTTATELKLDHFEDIEKGQDNTKINF